MKHLVLFSLLLASATPVIAQQAPKGPPGRADRSLVKAGNYKVDTGHTQVLWTVNHLGFSNYDGQFGGVTGTLRIDPARLSSTRLSVTIPMSGITTTVAGLTTHLGNADFFDASRFPAATFTSTSAQPRGQNARIVGNLTLRGVTRPVVLDARFIGAGASPMGGNATNVGFEATTSIKRSDFGISYGVPMVGDEVRLRINAAFVHEGTGAS